MAIPTTTYISREEVCKWVGIDCKHLYKVAKAGKLHAIKLPGYKTRKYLTKEIIRVFMKGVSYEDMGETK